MFPFEAVGDLPAGSAAWWQERDRREQRRRLRPGGLSLDRILAAALGVLDAEGLDALTMRGVAHELGTGVASLYRHVANKGELLVELVDAVVGEIVLPEPGAGWRTNAQELGRDLRRAFRGRRAQLLARAPGRLLGPRAVRLKGEVFGRLLAQGLAPDAAARLYFVVTHFVFGWILFEDVIARGQDPSTSRPDTASGPSGRSDVLVVLGVPTPDETFELGLGALLDGLVGRFAELGFPPPRPP